jgi:uncharacterized membrane protein
LEVQKSWRFRGNYQVSVTLFDDRISSFLTSFVLATPYRFVVTNQGHSTYTCSIMPHLWITVLIVLVWAIIRWLEGKAGVPGQEPVTSLNEPSVMKIPRRRYARGEIDAATFERMREQLETSTLQAMQRSFKKILR